jgi:hypothetical protein
MMHLVSLFALYVSARTIKGGWEGERWITFFCLLSFIFCLYVLMLKTRHIVHMHMRGRKILGCMLLSLFFLFICANGTNPEAVQGVANSELRLQCDAIALGFWRIWKLDYRGNWTPDI